MLGEKTLHELNEARKKVLLRNFLLIVAILLLAFSLFVFPALGMIGIIAVIAGSLIFNGKGNYSLLYKETIVRNVYEKLFDNIDYRPESGFDRDWVEDKMLISNGNRFSSDDYLSGEYKGCHFERSDIKMQDHRSNGKTSTTVTLFEGPWMVFDFHKSFHSYTKVVEKEFMSSGKPSIFQISVSEVEMESVAFNEIFRVYTTNEHDAFYILTPHLMEKLLELEKRYPGRMTAGFINGRLHVLLYTNENAFEAPILNEVTEKDAYVCEQQARIICEIIDSLNLDEMEENI